MTRTEVSHGMRDTSLRFPSFLLSLHAVASPATRATGRRSLPSAYGVIGVRKERPRSTFPLSQKSKEIPIKINKYKFWKVLNDMGLI